MAAGIGRIRVLAADDHPIYREGLVRAIGARAELELVGEASDGIQALAAIRSLRPDVALLDVMMPRLGGIEILNALLRDGIATRTVVISACTESALVYEAMTAGACAFLPKEADRDRICDALLAAARGQVSISPELQTGFVKEVRRRVGDNGPILSQREREVLVLTAEGLSRTQIADRLFLSPHTIKSHLHGIYDKLGVSDRAAMIAEAMRRGLIE